MKHLSLKKILALCLLISLSKIGWSQIVEDRSSFFKDGATFVDFHGSYQFTSTLTETLGGSSPTSGTTEGKIFNDFGFSIALGRTFPVSKQFGSLVIEGEYLSHPSGARQEFGGLQFDNEFNLSTFMANVHWMYPINNLNLFAGGGLGTTNITLKTSPIDNPSFEPFEQDANGFIYQLQVGGNLFVGDLVSFSIGYRFSNANNVNEDLIDPTNGEEINLRWDATTHRIELGVGVRL